MAREKRSMQQRILENANTALAQKAPTYDVTGSNEAAQGAPTNKRATPDTVEPDDAHATKKPRLSAWASPESLPESVHISTPQKKGTAGQQAGSPRHHLEMDVPKRKTAKTASNSATLTPPWPIRKIAGTGENEGTTEVTFIDPDEKPSIAEHSPAKKRRGRPPKAKPHSVQLDAETRPDQGGHSTVSPRAKKTANRRSVKTHKDRTLVKLAHTDRHAIVAETAHEISPGVANKKSASVAKTANGASHRVSSRKAKEVEGNPQTTFVDEDKQQLIPKKRVKKEPGLHEHKVLPPAVSAAVSRFLFGTFTGTILLAAEMTPAHPIQLQEFDLQQACAPDSPISPAVFDAYITLLHNAKYGVGVPYLIFPLGLSQAILDRSINPVGFTQSLTYVRALMKGCDLSNTSDFYVPICSSAPSSVYALLHYDLSAGLITILDPCRLINERGSEDPEDYVQPITDFFEQGRNFPKVHRFDPFIARAEWGKAINHYATPGALPSSSPGATDPAAAAKRIPPAAASSGFEILRKLRDLSVALDDGPDIYDGQELDAEGMRGVVCVDVTCGRIKAKGNHLPWTLVGRKGR